MRGEGGKATRSKKSSSGDCSSYTAILYFSSRDYTFTVSFPSNPV